ncbi:MAG: ester cyclase [Anaerolineales bacterium]|nr:ester cyclase [Anaerolineales bacterium]
MAGEAKALAAGLAAAWSRGDVEGIVSFFTDDCVFEDVCHGVAYRGKDGLRAEAKRVLESIPDLRLEVESVFGDRDFGCEWVETGTQGGRRFSVRGASIVETRGGKIKREAMYGHMDGATWFDA